MGKKGFTLVEMVVVVFLISLVFGIASYSVIGIINKSKVKSEKLFVEDIEKAISEYVSSNGYKLVKGDLPIEFNKCLLLSCDDVEDYEKSTAYEMYNSSLERVKLSVLLDGSFFDDGKIVNPVNKMDCLNGKDPYIRIFKDSDYVYYYYVDLKGNKTSCNISSENGVINTLSDDLKTKVGIGT